MAEEQKKKWYKRWWFRVPVAIIGLILLVRIIVTDFIEVESFATDTCEELSPQIAELSEKDHNPLKPKILKISETKKGEPNEKYDLVCSGMVKLSNGTDRPLTFYMTKPDKDGDVFIGYELQ